MTRHYNNRARKVLAEKIKQLGQTEHDELLRILKSHNVPFTQNSNGVFINISAVADAAIAQLDEFVKFCMDNMQELDEYDKRLNECKQNASGIISTMSYADNIGGGESACKSADTMGIESAAATIDATNRAENDDHPTELDDWDGFIDNCSVDIDRVRAFSMSISAYKNPSVASSVTKKKTCTKFNTAKKKYAKKRNNDMATTNAKGTSNQQQLSSVLVSDDY